MPDLAQTLAWKDVAAWLFFAGWSMIGLFVAGKISSMSTSVEALNVNVAVVVDKVGSHEKRIERLERRDDDRGDLHRA